MVTEFKPQYFVYEDLCNTGYQVIDTSSIHSSNIGYYFYGLINILKDGIEKEKIQAMMVHVKFQDNEEVDLYIPDFIFNVMFWNLNTSLDQPINSVHIVFPEDITKGYIANYINQLFIKKYRKKAPFIVLNQTIDSVIGKFRELRPFQLYLANTLNLEDTIDLMRKYPEFNNTVHFDVSNIPLADVKNAGLDAAKVQIEYIKNSDHCLRDSFRTGEAISPKQYKEVAVNIGTKPDGHGSVFPHPIYHSFMNGGLQTPEEITVESSVGRTAQILQKGNVGESGAFARRLELNNQDTFLHYDPSYICDTQNFEKIVIENETMYKMYDMRYYRDNPRGVDKYIDGDNMVQARELIGKTIYLRSPMKCASAARGEGICYKCYGDLAYVNQEINVGQIASEGLSSIYTQILLSAKHLLESAVIKLKWSEGFDSFFQVTFNTFALKEEMTYHGYHLIINDDIETEEEYDDITYNYYINNFIIRTPDGSEYPIHTTEADNIYIVPEFMDYINSVNNESDSGDETFIDIDMGELKEFTELFIMKVRNDEISSTMDKIEKLINNKAVISKHDADSILKEFVMTNIHGGITLNSVHFEVLLMNQIRALDDDIEMPDWRNPNAKYQILALNKALSNNRSITIRLQSDKISKVLTSPQNRYLNKPANIDLFYMEQPQEYLSDDYISDEYKPISDKDDLVREPIVFENKKIRVGRRGK